MIKRFAFYNNLGLNVYAIVIYCTVVTLATLLTVYVFVTTTSAIEVYGILCVIFSSYCIVIGFGTFGVKGLLKYYFNNQ